MVIYKLVIQSHDSPYDPYETLFLNKPSEDDVKHVVMQYFEGEGNVEVDDLFGNLNNLLSCGFHQTYNTNFKILREYVEEN